MNNFTLFSTRKHYIIIDLLWYKFPNCQPHIQIIVAVSYGIQTREIDKNKSFILEFIQLQIKKSDNFLKKIIHIR